MKKVFAIVMMMFACFVHAENVNLNVEGELSEEQKQQLALQAQKMITDAAAAKNAAPAKPEPTTPEQVMQWAEVGKAIGGGLASAARELGVAANDFAKTDVGIFTMVLIGWHYMGAQVVGIVFGTVWLVVMIALWLWMYRRRRFTKTVSHYDKAKSADGLSKRVVFEPNEEFDKCQIEHTMYYVTLAGIVLIGLITIF